MIEFSIPDSQGTRALNMLLLELIDKKPDMFYDDIKITSTYGTFNGCTWNGGRDILGIVSENDCKKILQFYNSKGVSYRYTFTNRYLENRDTYDRYCNMLLRINTKNNGVTYNLDLIKDYIKANYPTYYFVSSCTRNIKDITEIDKKSENELLVLDFKLNNMPIIKDLKHKENIEIIVNEQCMETCPYRDLHYSMIAKKNLFITDAEFDFNFMCKWKNGSYDEIIKTKRHYVSRQQIINDYLPIGINKFKIAGRHEKSPDFALMSYLDFFVKPEYKSSFMEICKNNGII